MSPETRATLVEITNRVARTRRVRVRDIIGNDTRTPAITDARHQSWYLAHLAGVSRADIAEYFGRATCTVRDQIKDEINGSSRNRRAARASRKKVGETVAPAPPPKPRLPADRSQWTELDWWRAMAHEENMAMARNCTG